MFVDASALTAILAHEADWAGLLKRIDDDPVAITAPIAIWETVVAIARIRNLSPVQAEGVVAEFLLKMGIAIVAIPPEAAHLAVEAFDRFGKGRHAAALNMGDCFAWACARHYRMPMLYKGADFDLTDIARA